MPMYLTNQLGGTRCWPQQYWWHRCLYNKWLALIDIFVTYKDHLSVNRIRANFDKSYFHFATVSQQEVKTVIQNISNNKANLLGDIPSKNLKFSLDCYLPELTKIINNCFEKGDFHDEVKLSEVLPIFKKHDSLLKENYRSVSILSHVSKIIEIQSNRNIFFHQKRSY